ncbi:MAG: DUF1565 domain-containing protein [Phormidesmis sp.]
MLGKCIFARNSFRVGVFGVGAKTGAIAASALALGIAAGAAQAQTNVSVRAQSTAAQSTAIDSSQVIASGTTADYQTLYVNPTSGSDRAGGVADQPLQTVTRALELAAPNTVIVLAPGRYTQSSGEVFPLRLKTGVTIQGSPGMNNRDAVIEGGGNFESPMRQQQNAAIIAADRAGIAQVAVSNPDGYGVWVESASPVILESAFVGNRQTGIYVTDGSPRVQDSYFSDNQVAGLIVFGVSSANIQSNTFEKTGDAIRVMDGATPEIVGNRMTNNEAGLVLIGNSHPVLRDNEIVGNRRNDVVEVASGTEDIISSADLSANEASADEASVDEASADVSIDRQPSSLPLAQLIDSRSAVNEQPLTNRPVGAQSAIGGGDEFLRNGPEAGAPGSALAALRSGLAAESAEVALGPRAVTGRNPGSSVLRPSRTPSRREDDTERSPERDAEPFINPAPVINNNRLSVPNSSIPVGSGSSTTVFAPPRGGVGGPPAPPSRAQALGLYYRVFVEASDPFMQDEVKEIVPDAFRTQFEGRMVMQVGAFPTEDEAEDRKQLLEDHDLDVRVEYIR